MSLVFKYFSASVLVHLLVALVLIALARPRPIAFMAPPKTTPAEIEVELHSSTPAANHGENSKSSARHTNKLRTKALQLSDLGTRYGFNVTTAKPQGHPSHRDGDLKDGADSATSLLQNSDQTGVYQYIYGKIDGSLVYPAELKEKDIQGTVQVQFEINDDGTYSENTLKVRSATSPFLKVLIARVLRRALLQPIPTDLMKKLKNELKIYCYFQFEITEHNNSNIIQSKISTSSKNLAFYRNFHHSALQWKLGPLNGLGPLAGMDVLWFPEKIGELFSNKSKVDPLEKYREDPAWERL